MIGRGRNLSEARDEIVIRVRGNQPTRLDVFLRESLAWKSRTRIQNLIRSGYVSVNVETRPSTKPSMVVRAGDQITVRLSNGTGMPDYSRYQLEIIYEDPFILGLNKPPGMLVHPVGRHVYDTLMNYLHYRYRDAMTACSEFHLRLCHRIDKDTTGILLVGKDNFVHRSVQKQLEQRTMSKEYHALVTGHVPSDLSVVDRPIGEGRNLDSALNGPGLKQSKTRIRVLRRFREYTLVAANPVTGRQNQIRVHLAGAGHPLVGDERYGGPPAPDGFPQRFNLHARLLQFYHPRLKSWVSLEAPQPADLAALLDTLT
jgi:23S rRNA pseudouridine1911/1915/1917 synthase